MVRSAIADRFRYLSENDSQPSGIANIRSITDSIKVDMIKECQRRGHSSIVVPILRVVLLYLLI